MSTKIIGSISQGKKYFLKSSNILGPLVIQLIHYFRTAHPSGAPEFTPPPPPPVFSEVRVTRSLVLYVCFVDRCLSLFFWPLCCLPFFDIRILITPLVSSNSSFRVCFYRELSSNYCTKALRNLKLSVVSDII